ncbi:MAG: APC family permease, partial [Elusimicrobia bacterium]|nr:APC family permease [Elusimicrobiota bacterium]
MANHPSWVEQVKVFVFGKGLNPLDRNLFHNLSLIAFFAWVGLGADGLSSSCYGPEEAFLAMQGHPYLSIFVALASVLTIFVISAGYSQIIELFPTGGGGYLVASKLLNPTLGMISGCALIVDYVLTITISVASGADALFSFLPADWYPARLWFAAAGVLILTILNLRGVKESVLPLVPIFLTFVVTHLFFIIYAIIQHMDNIPEVARATALDIQTAKSQIGVWGILFLILKAFSHGAGTFTGIEAVSNNLPILREPRVETGKRTMRYMAYSLAFTVLGLMLSYLLNHISPQPGKTLNAVLFETVVSGWESQWGKILVFLTLFSEAAILFIASQAGFLGGPQVLSNMALDRWFPSRFTMLSDRFVSQNGVLIMGISGLILMLLTHGSVRYLVILYSINVFITFVLSHLGMVRHWYKNRARVQEWKEKILICGTGLLLTSFILISVILLKFNEGGWLTLLITSTLIIFALLIKRHYQQTALLLKRLQELVVSAMISIENVLPETKKEIACDSKAKTAVILVNGFNGLGLHTLYGVIRLFGGLFKNFVFIHIGVIDSGTFKGAAEVENLQAQVKKDVEKYVH